jgi:hypothetical protein
VDAVVHSHDLVSGTLLDGVFTTTSIFPRYSETGIWAPEYVYLVDNVGNHTWLYPNDLAAMGLNIAVNVTVPEPTSILLLPVVALGLMICAWRRRTAAL